MVFLADDGIRIHFRADFPKQGADANLLLVHGLGEHGGRYNWLVERLNEFGVAVYRIDLRGHGCSEGQPVHVEEFEQFHRDLDSWYEFLLSTKEFDKELPLFLLGHSMGGLICLDYILNYRGKLRSFLDALSVSSPSIASNPIHNVLKPILDIAVPSFLNGIHVPNGIDSADLSHDPKICREYDKDPLVHRKITPQLFREIISTMKRVRHSRNSFPVPTQFLISGEDKIVDAEVTINFAKSLDCGHKDIRILHGFYHEVFNEVQKADAWNLLREWLFKWKTKEALQNDGPLLSQ